MPNTPYGFRFGPMLVTRLHSDEKHGVWIEIATDNGETLVIRATKTGRLRVGKVEKKRRSVR